MSQAKLDSSAQVIPNYARYPQQGLHESNRGLAITYSFNQSHRALGKFVLETIYKAPQVYFEIRLDLIQDKTPLLKIINAYKCHVVMETKDSLHFEISEKNISSIINQLVVDKYIPESLKKDVLSLVVENRAGLYTIHQEYHKTKKAQIEAQRIAKERDDKIAEENRQKKAAEIQVLIKALLEKDPKVIEKLKSFGQPEIDILFSALEDELYKQIPSFYSNDLENVAIFEPILQKFEAVAQTLFQLGMKYSSSLVNLPLEIQIMRTAIEKTKKLTTSTAPNPATNSGASIKGSPPSMGAPSFSLFSQSVENDKRFTKSNKPGVLYEASSYVYITDEDLKKYGFQMTQVERKKDGIDNIVVIKQLDADCKTSYKMA